MHAEEKIAMRILAEARRAIDAGHATANELPDPERERRVVIYAGLLRLHVKHAATSRKRGFSGDNSLGCAVETRPPAVNLQQKG